MIRLVSFNQRGINRDSNLQDNTGTLLTNPVILLEVTTRRSLQQLIFITVRQHFGLPFGLCLSLGQLYSYSACVQSTVQSITPCHRIHTHCTCICILCNRDYCNNCRNKCDITAVCNNRKSRHYKIIKILVLISTCKRIM